MSPKKPATPFSPTLAPRCAQPHPGSRPAGKRSVRQTPCLSASRSACRRDGNQDVGRRPPVWECRVLPWVNSCFYRAISGCFLLLLDFGRVSDFNERRRHGKRSALKTLQPPYPPNPHLSPCISASSRASMAPGSDAKEIVQRIERKGFGVISMHLPNAGGAIPRGAGSP